METAPAQHPAFPKIKFCCKISPPCTFESSLFFPLSRFLTTSLSVANDYFQHVSATNIEEAKKLQFVDYLNQVFGQDEEARTIINDFTDRTEHKVLNANKL
ncbi:hypothetical protein [Hymenobacter perfusus]|uniref:Uncharacterized protein n=1 Tax=Hymenobacter perfusus TaxID=1236770 RepID=A0A3R9MI49_9BACT|nr:hypothetical protein [Hymenobacter perfusus]RSK46368.1 hypothetical protein EI293_04145 [Hymenobacter perfusus]